MKKLADLQQGARFLYGGVEWVILNNDTELGATLAVAAEPVFFRAFDEKNRNDWREASLRRELNGPFLDELIQEGANRAAFLAWESDLTADDGMTDYGTAVDRIALLSDGLYRKYRKIIPAADQLYWTLTPWTCNPEYIACAHYVNSSGTLDSYYAHSGDGGVRPICYLESFITVKIPGEDDPERQAREREKTVQEAAEAVMQALEEYGAAYWVEALTRAMYGVFTAQRAAEDIQQEQADARALDLAPGTTINLNVNITETIDAAEKESE